MIKTMYYRKLKAGEACKKCGRPLIVVALDGKVFTCCLRCTHRKLVSRVSSKKKS